MNLFSDIRFALRLLIKNPGSSAMAILVMAVGTGVAITMFAFLNGVLWSSLNLKNEQPLQSIEWSEGDKLRNFTELNPLDLKVFAEESKSFAQIFGYEWDYASWHNPAADRPARSQKGARVTTNFFEALGERPILGRDFLPEDIHGGVMDKVILSHSLWMSDFEGREEVIGSIVMIQGKACTVVGVMRPGFRFPEDTPYWRAYGSPSSLKVGRKSFERFYTLGFLKAGVTVDKAKAELATIAQRLAEAFPETNDNLLSLNIRPFNRWYAGDFLENTSYALLICSLLVLGVASANVFNLIMTRVSTRTSELSIRSALGASRAHVVFQVVLDGLILTSIGALGGILLSGWSLKLVWAHLTRSEVPYWWHLNLDGRVMAFVVGVVLVAALASSLIPGLRASRTATAENLKDDTRTSSGLFIGALSRAILGVQVTVTGVLAFVSILMLLVWTHMKDRGDLHYDPDSIWMGVFTPGLAAALDPSDSDEKKNEDLIVFINRFIERLESIPGASGAAIAGVDPMHPWRVKRFEVDGVIYDSPESKPSASILPITSKYADVFGLEVLAGRGFTDLDTYDSQRVCMVNKSMADHYWPNEDPLGKPVRILGYNPDGEGHRTVVGVYSNTLPKPLPGANLLEGGHLNIYVPFSQNNDSWATAVVSFRGRQVDVTYEMQRALQELSPDLAFEPIRTVSEALDAEMIQQDVTFGMFGAFGIASLVMGVVGLYAVMSFTTLKRYREFGIRMAMGAHSGEIILTVVKRGLLFLAGAGLLGLAGGHVLSIYLKQAIDLPDLPMGYAYPLVILVLLLATLVSMGVPAWRASRISPMQALRVE